VDFERFCFVPHGFLVGVTSSLIFFWVSPSLYVNDFLILSFVSNGSDLCKFFIYCE
jgi:hypothetical protein